MRENAARMSCSSEVREMIDDVRLKVETLTVARQQLERFESDYNACVDQVIEQSHLLIRQIRRQEVQLLESIESIREEEYNRLGFSEDDVDAQLVIYRDVLQRWEQSPLFYEERRRQSTTPSRRISPPVASPTGGGGGGSITSSSVNVVIHAAPGDSNNYHNSGTATAPSHSQSLSPGGLLQPPINGYGLGHGHGEQLATIHETQSIGSHMLASSAEELPLLGFAPTPRRDSVSTIHSAHSMQTTTTTLTTSGHACSKERLDIMSEEYEEKVAEWKRCLQDIIDNDRTSTGIGDGIAMPALVLEVNMFGEKFASVHVERGGGGPDQHNQHHHYQHVNAIRSYEHQQSIPGTPEDPILQTVRRLRSLSTSSYTGMGSKHLSHRSLMSLSKRDTSSSSRMDLGTVADLTIDRDSQVTGNGPQFSSLSTPDAANNASDGGPAWRGNMLTAEPREESCVQLVWEITEEGSAVGQVRCPADVSFMADGKLLIADTENLRLQIYDQRGRWHANIGAGKIKPRRIAVMPDGQLTITDALGSCVKIINMANEKITTFGKGKALKNVLKSPCAIAISRSGEFVVSDSTNGTVAICRPDGKNTQLLASVFKNPTSVFVDSKGRILVADNWEHCVKVFDSSGQFLFEIAELAGPGSQRLQYPSSVCCDRQGNIYVSEWGKHTVCQFDEEGRFVRYVLTRDNDIRHPTGLAVHDNHLVVCEYSDEHSSLRLFKLTNV